MLRGTSPGRSETNTNSQVLLCAPPTPVRHPTLVHRACLAQGQASHTAVQTGRGHRKTLPTPTLPSRSPVVEVRLAHASEFRSLRSQPRLDTAALPPVECDKGVSQAHRRDRRFPRFPPSTELCCGSRRPGSTLSPEKQDLHFIRLVPGTSSFQSRHRLDTAPPLVGHPHFRPLQHTDATYACPPEHMGSQTRPECRPDQERGPGLTHPLSASFSHECCSPLYSGTSPRARGCVCK